MIQLIQAVLLCLAPGLFMPNISSENIETENLTIDTSLNVFLFLSDVHLNSTDSSSETYYHSDTKVILWQKAKEKLAERIQIESPQFIIYTGDLPDHFPQQGPTHNDNIKTMLQELRDLAGTIPLFYAPGNNDALNGDYFPFSKCNKENAFSLDPNGNYPAPNAMQVYSYDTIHGYYSAKPFDGLRIIALNSVLLGHSYITNNCFGKKLKSGIQLIEGDKQINWFQNQVAEADSMGEKVYIIMHIPPGLDAYKSKNGNNYKMWAHDHWQSDFLKTVDSFQNSVSAVLYGHTHMEEVRLLASPNGGYSQVAFSCPGITPRSSNNPGFKMVEYNSSFEPTNFTTHYMELPNTSFGDKSYSFYDIYNNSQDTTATISELLLNKRIDHLGNDMQAYFKVRHGYGSDWCKLSIVVQ